MLGAKIKRIAIKEWHDKLQKHNDDNPLTDE
jgi:hypothetical protein